jgi:tetratricopeptide (TPR) repeat protein
MLGLLVLLFAAGVNDAQDWLARARSAAGSKDMPVALEAAKKAEELGGEDPAILVALAELYGGPLADPVKAARLGARYAERKPDDQTAWRRLAAFCLKTGQPDCAVEAATRGLPGDDSAELHGLLGRAYAERKDWAKAGPEFARSVQINPYDEGAQFRLAQVYLFQQEYVAAAAALEEARKVFDKSAQLELTLGVAYYGARDFPRAVDQFLRTIRLAPDVPQPYVFLGKMLEHAEGRMPVLTARFAEFEARNPKDPLGYVLHAKAILQQLPPSGFPPEARNAVDLLRKAIEFAPDHAEAHYLLGILLERRGDLAGAATHLERSVALNAKNPLTHYRLARVYARLGRTADAERERALHEKLSEEESPPDRRSPSSGR